MQVRPVGVTASVAYHGHRLTSFDSITGLFEQFRVGQILVSNSEELEFFCLY